MQNYVETKKTVFRIEKTAIELISQSEYEANPELLQEYKSLSRSNLKLDFADRQLCPTDKLIHFFKSEGKLLACASAEIFNLEMKI